jgi:hypothetical protein
MFILFSRALASQIQVYKQQKATADILATSNFDLAYEIFERALVTVVSLKAGPSRQWVPLVTIGLRSKAEATDQLTAESTLPNYEG